MNRAAAGRPYRLGKVEVAVEQSGRENTMNSKLAHRPEGIQSGFVMVAVLALVTALLGIGLAFMRWATDESIQSVEASAAMQAYYLGQMGVVERGFPYLRSLAASDLPVGETVLPGRRVSGYGEYSQVEILYLPSLDEDNFWAQDRRFRISCIGMVRVPVVSRSRSSFKDIKRKAVLYVEVRNFADYMYLSHREMTSFGDRIKFWAGDTLNGRVHSNSEIAIMQNPQFYDMVTTTETDFWRGTGYNPGFHGPPPQFRVPPVEIPQLAERLRAGAASQGNFYTYPGQTIRAVFNGGTAQMTRWPTGTPFDPNNTWPVTLTQGTCIFIDGPAEVMGTVQGRVTIGSRSTMRLLDNITVVGADAQGRVPLDNRNFIGLVSEAEIKIANTLENGRENAGIAPPASGRNQTNPSRSSIVITAAVVALGESFTFENQNDADSGYVCWCAPDDRGTIYLWGSLTQMRRGYVHRSTRNSTGYLKQYRYDRRLLYSRPPCFFDVTNEEGKALFNIVQWGQGVEYPPDVNNWNVVRYN